MNKSWIDKRDCQKSFKIKTTTKRFADILEGSNMLIASPPIINDYVKSLPYGKFVEPSTMRENLAKNTKQIKLVQSQQEYFCELFQKHRMRNIDLVMI